MSVQNYLIFSAFGEVYLCLLKMFLFWNICRLYFIQFLHEIYMEKVMQELFLMSFLGHPFCSNDTKIHLNVAQEGWKGYVKVNTSEQGKRVKIDGESAEVHYGSWSTHLLVVKNSGKKVYLLLHSGKMIWLKTHGNSRKMFQIFLSKPLPYHHLQSLDLRQELQL